MDYSRAWIQGAVLRKTIDKYKPRHTFEKIGNNERRSFDPDQYRYLLGEDRTDPVPFVIQDNLFVTVNDIDHEPPIIDFTNVRFTRLALESAVATAKLDEDAPEGSDTKSVEALAESSDLRKPDAVLAFSHAVCRWGGGERVWANMHRYNSDQAELGRRLSEWLVAAREESDPLRGIAPGIAIKGLGVSFASKHLRLLVPEKFGVLDDVLQQGLGYALNAPGYKLFCHDLFRLKKEHGFEHSIAELEYGIFLLVRQIVRSK